MNSGDLVRFTGAVTEFSEREIDTGKFIGQIAEVLWEVYDPFYDAGVLSLKFYGEEKPVLVGRNEVELLNA